jgi:hypothetical protein
VIGIGKCSVEDQLLCVFAFDLESGRKLWTGCDFCEGVHTVHVRSAACILCSFIPAEANESG